MNMKRFAVRGIIIFACVLIACAFLSGTIMSLTCPHIKITQPKMGKTEKKLELDTEVYFSDTEEIKPAVVNGYTFTVKEICTRAGYTAAAGETLIVAEVNDYEQKKQELLESYSEAEKKLAELNEKESEMRIRESDESYVKCKQELEQSSKELLEARAWMNACLENEGLTLENYEGATDECLAAVETYNEIANIYSETEKQWQKFTRYNIDEEVYSYLTERIEYENKLEETENDLEGLMAAQRAASSISCAHDCTVTAVNVEAGAVWDGSGAMVTVSAEGAVPMLKSTLTAESTKMITKNSAVSVSFAGDEYTKFDSRVKEIKKDIEGQYALMDLNDDIIYYKGSMYSVWSDPPKATVTEKSQTSYCLVDAGAVYGDDKERYVFEVTTDENILGDQSMTVSKIAVTVIGEYDDYIAIGEDLTYCKLAYMADKELSDGQTVLQY